MRNLPKFLLSSLTLLALSACDNGTGTAGTGGALQQDGASSDVGAADTGLTADIGTTSDVGTAAETSDTSAADTAGSDAAQAGTDAGATDDVAPACKSTYADVQPILSVKCTGSCHKHSFHQQCLFAAGMSKSIKAQINAGMMPPKGEVPLTSEEKAKILKWIADGSLCEGGC